MPEAAALRSVVARAAQAAAALPLRASLLYSLLTLGLLLVLALSDVVIGPSLATAAIACGLVTAYLAVLLKNEALFFVLAFRFLFGQYGAILGGVFIEAGSFVLEQERFGFATGATVRLSIYLLLLLTVGLLLFQLFVPHGLFRDLAARTRIRREWRWLIYALTILVLAFLAMGLAVNGSPLLEQRDRFSYWQGNAVPFLQPVHNQLSTLVFLLGLCLAFAARGLERWLTVGLFLLSLVYFVFQGEKFTALVLVSYSFALPIAVRAFARREVKPSLLRVGMLGLAGAGLLLGLILYQYATVFSSNTPMNNLAQRVALQGHVWWGVDDAYRLGQLPIPPDVQRQRELEALLSLGPPAEDVGMTLMMRTVAPEALVNRYLRQGIRFTMGYPAIGLYLFGPAGLAFLQVAVGVLMVLVARLMATSIVGNRVLQAVIAYKLLFEVSGVFGPGNLHELFSDKILLYLAAALLLPFLAQGVKAGRSRFPSAPTQRA